MPIGRSCPKLGFDYIIIREDRFDFLILTVQLNVIKMPSAYESTAV